jgi:hypothetical protein
VNLDKSKKESPQQGDYIDLKGSDYKKKSNYLRNIILFLFFLIIGVVSGFFLKKEMFKNFNFIESQKEIFEVDIKEEEINTNNKKILELETELESYLQKVEQVENNLLKIQNENIQIKKGLKEFKSFPLSNGNNANTNNYEVYFTFEKFKYNFFNNKEFKGELNKLFQTFSDLDELQLALNYFQRFQPGEIIDVKAINKKLNYKISSYNIDLESFAKKLEYEKKYDVGKVFNSMEDFSNYIKNIFSSTFKITKLDERKMETIPLNNGWIINTLKKSKDYLVLGDLKNFIIELESLGVDDSEISKILDEAKMLDEININLKRIETQIFKLIGKNFDNNY